MVRMQKTRVLFVMLQLDAGGSERVVYDLVRSLDRDEFEIFVAAFKGGVLAESLKKECIDLFFIEKKAGFDPAAMLRLAQIVKEHRIDVVNAHHYMPCFYSFLGTRILNGKKLVFTEHSVAEVESVADGVHGTIFNWMLYRINAVVGVSRAITEKFREKYPRHAGRFHEILNGVDIDKFRENGARNEVRSSWGLTGEHFVVGTVANFRRVKNHACLVRAAGRLKHTHPQLRLLLVGTGFQGDPENSEDEIQALIRELGMQDRVVLAGYQENIPKILSAFDAFCLTSFSEGLPVSLLEAMASGVPVIGSEVKGIVEVVKDGRTGFLFPSNSDAALSGVLKKILESPGSARSLVDEAFSFVNNDHNIKQFQEGYSRVLAC